MTGGSARAIYRVANLIRMGGVASLMALVFACNDGGGNTVATTTPVTEASPTVAASPADEGTSTVEGTPSAGETPSGDTASPVISPPPELDDVRIGELPDGFPESFPLPEKSTVVFSGRLTSGDTDFFSVQLDVDDTLETVVEFYSEALDRPPWSVHSTVSLTELIVISFSNEEDPVLRGLIAIGPPPSEPGTISVALSLGIPATE